MSTNFEQKKLVVEEIVNKLSKAKSVILVDYRGINVEQDTQLRSAFRKADSDYKVYKNRLFERALKELNISGLDGFLQGTTAFAFGFGDEVSPAKVLKDFAKNCDKLEVKAALLNNRVITADEVKKLANLPSKPQLIGQLLSVLNAPARNLVGVLSAPMRGLAVALNAIATK